MPLPEMSAIHFVRAVIPLGRSRRLFIPEWHLYAGECWVIMGAGGSGKTSLAQCIAGRKDCRGMKRRGTLKGPGAWFSFDREREIRARLRKYDDSEWTGRPDEGTELLSFLAGGGQEYLDSAMLDRLKGRGIRHLSTGEFRQVLIAREAAQNPHLAVLDEPWEGLDIHSRPRLNAMLKAWKDAGALVILTVNRHSDIPAFADAAVMLENDSLRILDDFSAGQAARSLPEPESKLAGQAFRAAIPPAPEPPPETGPVLLDMQNISIAFQGRPALRDISWRINRGESWLLTGKNGSGKTTLLNLISGEEPRGYGQNIRIFGRRKGSGETTEWILRRIGQVSAMLQESVSRQTSVFDAVGSGLRDAVVLTRSLSGYEKQLIHNWLTLLNLDEKAHCPFRKLSYGERRLAMIARAMIKHPPLLLLDEPMHGLDGPSRRKVSLLVDTLVQKTDTTVVLVSHRPEDTPPSISRHMQLIPSPEGGYCARQTLR